MLVNITYTFVTVGCIPIARADPQTITVNVLRLIVLSILQYREISSKLRVRCVRNTRLIRVSSYGVYNRYYS